MSKVRLYNKTLCPLLWQDMKLDPEVRRSLLQAAKDFYEKTEFKAPIKDIYFMGSAANYNWTPDSDADVHILIDFKQLQMPEDTAFEAVKNASARWNDEHDIKVKGHKVEMNLQDSADKKPHATGIYSLAKNDWVRKPVPQRLNVNRVGIVSKYTRLKDYVEKAILSGDRNYMKSVKEYVDQFRQYGLDTKGELSTENLVFKILRSRGIMKKLKDAITATYDAELTVDEGYGAGIPETDRLHLAGQRWRIRSKDAPKTPKMKEEEVIAGDGHEKMINEAMKWKRLEAGEMFFDSEDGRFSIVPQYIGRTRPQNYKVIDNQTKQTRLAHTLKDAFQTPDRYWLNQKSPPPPPTAEYLQAAYEKAMKDNFPLFAADIKKNAAKRGIVLTDPPTTEVTQKDIKASAPSPSAIFKGDINLNRMTLGHLMHLKKKMSRLLKAYAKAEDQSLLVKMQNDYQLVSGEIERRMKYINRPVSEEGFDPTSMGPNPQATEGQPQDPEFYQQHNNRMRKLERVSLKEMIWGK